MNNGQSFFVYILASRKNGTLYIGVTNNLARRVWEHKQDLVKGFTKTHRVHRLVYFERFDDINFAIQREKTMKHWVRSWKVNAIEKENSTWRDLYEDLNL